MTGLDRRQAMAGAAFALLAVVLTATTDLLAKLLAADFPVQQVNFLAALVGIAGAWALSRRGAFGGGGLRTSFPGVMALRSVTAVAAAAGFFLSYKYLQLTEVFIVSALLPIFAGFLSGPILGERVALRHWVALAASFLGVALVMPGIGEGQAIGYAYGLAGSFFGALSLTMARFIGRHERNAAALVFYPQIALAAIMGAMLPGTALVPMGPVEIAMTVAFGLVFLFGKMALAAAFSRAPAIVVTPVVNLQFFALLALGYLAFGDMPAPGIYLGAAIVTAAGLYVTFTGAPAPASAPASAPAAGPDRPAPRAPAWLRRRLGGGPVSLGGTAQEVPVSPSR